MIYLLLLATGAADRADDGTRDGAGGKDDAHRTRYRVEARREQSGNASFSIREAGTSVVMSV